MKSIRHHIALWLLCATLSAAAGAQPPEHVTVTKGNPPEAVPVKVLTLEEEQAQQLQGFAQRAPSEIPGIVVNCFVGGALPTAAMGVAGADWKSPELHQLQDLVNAMGKRIRWEADVDPNTPLAPGATETTVKAQVGTKDEMGLQVWREETVVLRAEATKGGTIWRIVPEKPELVFSKRNRDALDIGLVRRIATYLAYPHEACTWLAVPLSMTQVKLLGLGMMQYTQDFDEHYPPTVAAFHEKIKPYTQDETLFSAPGDAVGHQSYNLNPYLAGRGLADLQEPAQTVAIYLGHDEKLDFRFDGRTVIGFADGHVKALNAEEAKTLRWKP